MHQAVRIPDAAFDEKRFKRTVPMLEQTQFVTRFRQVNGDWQVVLACNIGNVAE
jgi:hypothetical protein